MIAAAILATALPAAADAPAPRSVELITTAQRARLRDIDFARQDCDTRTVGPWLRTLVRPHAASIRWSAGRCRLVVPHHPLDSGAGAFCAQATIRPRGARHDVTLEFYMERRRGRSGLHAYAFRAVGHEDDGFEDYIRATVDFEAVWRRLRRLPALTDAELCRE